MHSAWIPIEKIQSILEIEAYAVTWILFFISFLFYWLFLKKISEKRHQNLRARFKNTPLFLLLSSALSLLHYQMLEVFTSYPFIDKASAYIGFFALILGAMSVIKLAQIYVYVFLFFSNMAHGVPKLLANMFTFIFSLVIINMIASSVFGIHLSALLATSAVFSLVLGLALQDTLGNLFSGVALQIDTPYKLGDWIEVHTGNEKWLGLVLEITWRGTFLLSFADELIMIPNRTISQSQIIIISQGNKNIRLNQTFRFSYDVSVEKVKQAIREGIAEVEGIMLDPPIRILITETNESFLAIKVFYSLVDFSTRYVTGDKIIAKVLESLARNKIKVQTPHFEINLHHQEEKNV